MRYRTPLAGFGDQHLPCSYPIVIPTIMYEIDEAASPGLPAQRLLVQDQFSYRGASPGCVPSRFHTRNASGLAACRLSLRSMRLSGDIMFISYHTSAADATSALRSETEPCWLSRYLWLQSCGQTSGGPRRVPTRGPARGRDRRQPTRAAVTSTPHSWPSASYATPLPG